MTFQMFDSIKASAKIVAGLNPVAANCVGASVWIYDHFRTVLFPETGFNLKPYVMNIVYNFGHMFDALRDVSLFFMENPRG